MQLFSYADCFHMLIVFFPLQDLTAASIMSASIQDLRNCIDQLKSWLDSNHEDLPQSEHYLDDPIHLRHLALKYKVKYLCMALSSYDCNDSENIIFANSRHLFILESSLFTANIDDHYHTLTLIQ